MSPNIQSYLVKNDATLKMIDGLVEKYSKITDEVIEKYVEPLKIIANPDTVIGRPYSMWKNDPNALAWLKQVYAAFPEILENHIAKEEVKIMYELEMQAKQLEKQAKSEVI